MKSNTKTETNRRHFIQKASIGLFGLSLSNNLISQNQNPFTKASSLISKRYPAIDEELTYNVVNASHFDFEKVKTLVTKRLELANASWDWGFGDFETAIGACSHTGRRDIAEFLICHGARPDIFTFAMMGMLNSLKELIETIPGIQSHRGPHGITLLKHVQTRLANKDITNTDKKNVTKVLNYLEKLGNANEGVISLKVTEVDKVIFLGNYKYGDGETETFNVGTSSLGPFINITRKGLPGRLLLKIGENTFAPTGAPSVKIVFELKNNQVASLTIYEPDLIVTAVKI